MAKNKHRHRYYYFAAIVCGALTLLSLLAPSGTIAAISGDNP